MTQCSLKALSAFLRITFVTISSQLTYTSIINYLALNLVNLNFIYFKHQCHRVSFQLLMNIGTMCGIKYLYQTTRIFVHALT